MSVSIHKVLAVLPNPKADSASYKPWRRSRSKQSSLLRVWASAAGAIIYKIYT